MRMNSSAQPSKKPFQKTYQIYAACTAHLQRPNSIPAPTACTKERPNRREMPRKPCKEIKQSEDKETFRRQLTHFDQSGPSWSNTKKQPHTTPPSYNRRGNILALASAATRAEKLVNTVHDCPISSAKTTSQRDKRPACKLSPCDTTTAKCGWVFAAE